MCTEPVESKHSHALPVWQIYCTREQSLKNTRQEFFFYLLTHPCLHSHPPERPTGPPGTNSSSTCLPTACLSFIWRPSLSHFSCFLFPHLVHFIGCDMSTSCRYLPSIYWSWWRDGLYLNWMLDLVLLIGLLLSLFILSLLSSVYLL